MRCNRDSKIHEKEFNLLQLESELNTNTFFLVRRFLLKKGNASV